MPLDPLDMPNVIPDLRRSYRIMGRAMTILIGRYGVARSDVQGAIERAKISLEREAEVTKALLYTESAAPELLLEGKDL